MVVLQKWPGVRSGVGSWLGPLTPARLGLPASQARCVSFPEDGLFLCISLDTCIASYALLSFSLLFPPNFCTLISFLVGEPPGARHPPCFCRFPG